MKSNEQERRREGYSYAGIHFDHSEGELDAWILSRVAVDKMR
jgi:hypothetical protein